MKFRLQCISNRCDSFDEVFFAPSLEDAEDYFYRRFEDVTDDDGILKAYTSDGEGGYWEYSLVQC